MIKNGNDKNNNDAIIKLAKNAKISKLFVIIYLASEELAQKKKCLLSKLKFQN